MSDFFEPIRIEDEDFKTLVEVVERAFVNGGAALVTDPFLTAERRRITIFDRETAGLGDAAWTTLRDAIRHFDQVLLFATEEAPEEVIRDWVAIYEEDEEDKELADRALARIEMIQENMPKTMKEWDVKTHSPIPVLHRPGFELLKDDEGRTDVVVSLSASALGHYEDDSTGRIIVRLTLSDVAYLQHRLKGIRTEMASKDGDS